jgi:hypothetical protein
MSSGDDRPEQQAQNLVARIFALLGECRGVQAQLATPGQELEDPSARAERELYAILLAALEDGLIRVMEDVLKVLQNASQPLGERGEEWLKRQERQLGTDTGEAS